MNKDKDDIFDSFLDWSSHQKKVNVGKPEMNPIGDEEESIDDEEVLEIAERAIENIDSDEDDEEAVLEDEGDEEPEYYFDGDASDEEPIPYNPVKKDEEDEEEEDLEDEDFEDDDIFDPQEESLLYSGDSKNSILFDELDNSANKKSSSSDEGEEGCMGSPKKSFADVSGLNKTFAAGRLNKTVMLSVIGGVFLLILLIFNFANMKKKAEINKGKDNQPKVSVGGYNPDFGDYKSRQYVPTKEEEDLRELKEVEDLLASGEKDEFIPDQTPVTPSYQPTYTETSYAPLNPKDPWEEAIESGLRVSGEGFGFSTVPEQPPSMFPPNIGNMQQPYNLTDQEVAQKYMDRIASVNNAMGNPMGNQNPQAKDDGRWTNAGAYDPNAQGGDVHSIPEYSLYPGTVINAVLVNGINTDYPGTITARVISNVFDSSTGKHLLIPAGSILRGSYSSSSFGVSRLQIAWQTLILNRDGRDYYVNLGSMVGVDKSGYSGIKGTLNEHMFQYLKAAGISALFTTINSNIFKISGKQKDKTVKEMIADSQDIGNRLADKIMDRALDIQPTVTVRPGTRVNIDVDKILTLVPYDVDLPKKKYIRK